MSIMPGRLKSAKPLVEYDNLSIRIKYIQILYDHFLLT